MNVKFGGHNSISTKSIIELDEILAAGSLKAAPQLLGWYICRQTAAGVLTLKIVETEAYHQTDPASHSFRGLTPRTAPMFQSGGRLYIYFTYGMHYCLNIVTGKAGEGEAVLLRAAEPVQGIKAMQANRGVAHIKTLANGPGKLAQAMGIKDTALSGEILNKLSIWLEPPNQPVRRQDIAVTPRIGIRKAVDQPWRFYIKGSPYVSKL